MKKITASILTTLLMLSMVFSSSVFAANEEVSAWDSFLGLFSGNATTTATDAVGVEYRGHIQNVGNFPLDGTWIQGPNQLGTVGQSLRLEGFWIRLSNQPENVNIQYRVHVQNEGWMTPVENGAFAGTEGKSQQIEAIEINLVDDEGNAVQGYSVMYKGHIQNQGDTAWFEDGQQLGTVGSFLRLEALEVKIVQTKADMTAYEAAVAEATALTEADYTAASWAALETALIDNLVTEDNTQAEVDAATAAINDAIDALVAIAQVTSIEALNATSAKVTFSGAVKAVVPANFAVTDANGNQVFVSNAVLNAAKDEATLTFFNAFTNNGVYTAVTSNVVDANNENVPTSTDSFTYVNAPASKVEFTGTAIKPALNVKTLVKVTDTLGRDITNEVAIEFETSNALVVEADGDTLNPSTPAADTAIVVAKVKVGTTYVRSANTIITVSDAVATSFAGGYVYTTADGAVADTKAFKALEADQIIDYVNMGVTTKSLALYYNDQYNSDLLGKVIAFNGVGEPTLTNLNPNVVVVENTGVIKPISVGTGYVKVVNGTVTSTVKIVVKAAPVVTTMTAEKTSVAIGTTAPLNTETVNVTYKDQFGTAIVPAAATLTATPADATIVTAVAANDGKTVAITSLKEGTTTVALSYKVDATTTLTQTINVTVTKPGTLAGYMVENAAATLDLNTNNTADPKTPASSVVKVFSVDANGNKIAELTANPAQFVLTAVDANGVADASIVKINADKKTVDAVAVGTGYVQVNVGTLLIDTLTFNVVNTGSVATTATFNSLAVVLGEVAVPAPLKPELQDIVTVQDQDGVDLAGFDKTKLAFEYVITNITGMTFDKTTQDASLTGMTAQNGLSDIVVTKVTYDGGTTNLIATPVIVKLSATDLTKPVVVGTTTKMLTATTFQVEFSEPVNAVAADFTNYKYDADGAGAGAAVAINVVSIAGSGTDTITVTTAANAGFATGVGTGIVDIGAGVVDIVGNTFTPVTAQPILTD
ncbi:hypothetical protein [Acetobacterium malicum]|uniref:hypothetical protein n=1 Tax=Acetobacterium malicum TaxID=52692 RepID=UPI0035933A69